MLKDFKEIIFGISERHNGKMKLANLDHDQATKNRQVFFQEKGIDNHQVVSAALANGLEIKIVDSGDAGQMIPGVDALITSQQDLVLAITVADCAPVYIYDVEHKVIALVHAGWRGVLGNIIGKTISLMQEKFSSSSKDLHVFVGPHLKVCHFEVQADVAEMFKKYESFIARREGEIYIDLTGIIKKQLLEVGVLAENTEFNPDCTYCADKNYFSWRRDKPQTVEAMLAYLGIIG